MSIWEVQEGETLAARQLLRLELLLKLPPRLNLAEERQ